MKILIFILFFLGSYTLVYSQAPLTYINPHNNSENLDQNNMLVRYWYYRWRLQNDFLIIGDKPGYSIPAENREGSDSWALSWGDGTIWLGNYICMLALENALLRYSDRYYDLLKNERELYYAMQAFNRLDVQGDTYYDADGNNVNSMPPSKNGFFIRDDVPARFFTTNYMDNSFDLLDVYTWTTTAEYAHFTSEKSGIEYHYHPFYALSSGDFDKQEPLFSLYNQTPSYTYNVPSYNSSYLPVSHDDKASLGLFSMSQDQVYRLLSGFATVIRTLPDEMRSIDTDDDGYGDTPFNFVEEAKIHSTNIIARTSGIDQNTVDYGSNVHYGALWFMHDPLNEKPGIGNYSADFSPEVSIIWDQNYTSQNNLGIPHSYVLSILASSHTSTPIYANAVGQSFTADDGVNAKLYLYTSLVSGFVPYKMNTHDGVFNHIFAFSKGNVINSEKTFGWHTYMTPLYCYLHNFHPQQTVGINNWISTRSDMATQVLTAPCWGPYDFLVGQVNITDPPTANNQFTLDHPGIDPFGNNGWCTTFRFDQTSYKAQNGYGIEKVKKHGDTPKKELKNVDGGYFNGIDYMSEVNLFYITSNTLLSLPTPLPFYQNLIDRYVDYTVSSDNTPMLGAFNSMIIVKPITGSGSLDVQAGSFINLQDGTHITASQPSKHIFIKTFSCNNIETGNYESPLVNDSVQETQPQRWLANNDYGFNEVFTQKQYDVHPNMSNAPTTQEILNSNNAIPSEETDSIVIYPNPARSKFSIKNILTQKEVNCNIYLQEMDGKIVPVEQTRGEYNISNLSPGTYIVHLLFPSGAVSDKKLIVLP